MDSYQKWTPWENLINSAFTSLTDYEIQIRAVKQQLSKCEDGEFIRGYNDFLMFYQKRMIDLQEEMQHLVAEYTWHNKNY